MRADFSLVYRRAAPPVERQRVGGDFYIGGKINY